MPEQPSQTPGVPNGEVEGAGRTLRVCATGRCEAGRKDSPARVGGAKGRKAPWITFADSFLTGITHFASPLLLTCATFRAADAEGAVPRNKKSPCGAAKQTAGARPKGGLT